MEITIDMLRGAGACNNQVELFREIFGEGGEVTLGNCRRAAKAGLDLDWAADRFFSASAEAAYRAAMDPARAAYSAAKAPARAAYQAAVDCARAAYRAAMDPAFFEASKLMAEVDNG